MNTLNEQYLQDKNMMPADVLAKVLDIMLIEKHDGGPEGIYYTHSEANGEYLYRNLHELIRQVYYYT